MILIKYLAKSAKFVRKQMSLKADVKAETGIGVLIIFIAMVLVAAVAASVLIHTAGILQQKATSTGTTTIRQVSSGIIETQVLGFDNATPAESGGVSLMAIFVAPNAGNTAINLANTSVTLNIGGTTAVLVYNHNAFANIASGGSTNVFGLKSWKNLSKASNDPTSFGVLVTFDPQKSMVKSYPVLSAGDSAAIIVNVTNTFGHNITQNSKVTGQVTPQNGAQALIDFTAPVDFVTHVVQLQ